MFEQQYFGPGSHYAPYPKEHMDIASFDDGREDDDSSEEDDSCRNKKKRSASSITPTDDTDESEERFAKAKQPQKDHLVSDKEEC